MIRKFIICIKRLHRWKYCLPLLIWLTLSLVTLYWLSDETSRALTPPPAGHDFTHFRVSTDLDYYLENIDLLIQPSSPCSEDPPLTVLVASTSSRMAQRVAIRDTWAKHVLTYFVMGVEYVDGVSNLSYDYMEAKQYGDMLVFNLTENYQNLTLKTALMLHWFQSMCQQVEYVFKTDDDVLVNPWTLERVVSENRAGDLVGYRVTDTLLHRDEYSKWFVPRWLHHEDFIPQYLSGNGYIIKGKFLLEILDKARKVPLINLEDVYMTYLVSNRGLNLSLTHDKRLSRYRPWVPFQCAYWVHATLHSFNPYEMIQAFEKIENVHKYFVDDKDVCSFYSNYLDSEWLLY